MTGWQQHRSTFARGASCLQKRHPSISRHGPKNPIYRAAHSFFISLPFTIEPGLYVRPGSDAPEPFHGIGIRIEDDAIVTDSGCELITRGVPVAPDEIEALMRA